MRLSLSVAALLAAPHAAADPGPAVPGDPAAGADKALFCASCHGLDGNPPRPDIPRLAGRPAATLEGKLRQYRAGKVGAHPMMAILTHGLTDRDVADLASFYAGRKAK